MDRRGFLLSVAGLVGVKQAKKAPNMPSLVTSYLSGSIPDAASFRGYKIDETFTFADARFYSRQVDDEIKEIEEHAARCQ